MRPHLAPEPGAGREGPPCRGHPLPSVPDALLRPVPVRVSLRSDRQRFLPGAIWISPCERGGGCGGGGTGEGVTYPCARGGGGEEGVTGPWGRGGGGVEGVMVGEHAQTVKDSDLGKHQGERTEWG